MIPPGFIIGSILQVVQQRRAGSGSLYIYMPHTPMHRPPSRYLEYYFKDVSRAQPPLPVQGMPSQPLFPLSSFMATTVGWRAAGSVLRAGGTHTRARARTGDPYRQFSARLRSVWAPARYRGRVCDGNFLHCQQRLLRVCGRVWVRESTLNALKAIRIRLRPYVHTLDTAVYYNYRVRTRSGGIPGAGGSS